MMDIHLKLLNSSTLAYFFILISTFAKLWLLENVH